MGELITETEIELHEEFHRLQESGDEEGAILLLEGKVADPDVDVARSWLYDELAWCYAHAERFDDAIEAMQKAIDAGYEGEPDARAFIADFLLRSGRTEEGDALFGRVKEKTPQDPWLYNAASIAYGETGRLEESLRWATEGLVVALEQEDRPAIGELHAVRALVSRELGKRADDKLQNRAIAFLDEEYRADVWAEDFLDADELQETVVGALGWFPPGEFELAVTTWSSFAEHWDGDTYEEYCASLDRTLRELDDPRFRRLVPIAVEEYVKWCAEQDIDPDTSSSRAQFSAELMRQGRARTWPPRRNDTCWCESGRKYKVCCGRPANDRRTAHVGTV